MQDHKDDEPSQPPDQQHELEIEPSRPQPRGYRRRSARMRVWGLAAGALAALVAVTLTTTSNSSPHLAQANTQSSAPAQQVDALLAGIPQAGDVLGSPSAPVTLQFYGDLECTTSRAFTLVDLPSIISRWVRRGQLRIEYRSLQTATRQSSVFITQQAAALAAGTQDKGWYYIELFYHEQGEEDSGYVTNAYLDSLADQTSGLNVALWGKDREEPPLAARVASDEQTAAGLGLRTTPALLIARTGAGVPHRVPRFFVRKPGPLYAAIEGAVAQASRARSSQATRVAATGSRSWADWTAGADTDETEAASC